MDDPANVTVPVPGVNVPELFQLPAMLMLRLLALLSSVMEAEGTVRFPLITRSVLVIVTVPEEDDKMLRLLYVLLLFIVIGATYSMVPPPVLVNDV